MSERSRAGVAEIDLRPDDRVLEIGSGHSVAATRVTECTSFSILPLGSSESSDVLTAISPARN